MKVLFLIPVLAILTSCASMKEEVKGYSGNERAKMLVVIKGRTAAEAKAIMGEPAAEGMCKNQCNYQNGQYQMVYLNETLPRYSFALSMANKSKLNCFIVYFNYDESVGKHVYDGTGVMDQTACAQSAIPTVRQLN